MGWFKDLTGISTPEWLKDIDDVVSPAIKGVVTQAGYGDLYNSSKQLVHSVTDNTSTTKTGVSLTNTIKKIDTLIKNPSRSTPTIMLPQQQVASKDNGNYFPLLLMLGGILFLVKKG